MNMKYFEERKKERKMNKQYEIGWKKKERKKGTVKRKMKQTNKKIKRINKQMSE